MTDRNTKHRDTFQKYVISLGSILFPILLGLVVRFKSPIYAAKLERLGNRAGLFAAVLMVVIWGPDFVNEIRWEQLGLYSVFFILFFAGILSGLFTAKVFKLPPDSCRAVSLETGIQNCPLTLTIMTLSFPAVLREDRLDTCDIRNAECRASRADIGALLSIDAAKTAGSALLPVLTNAKGDRSRLLSILNFLSTAP